VCKQQNKVRAARIVRLRRRTSTARDNWLITLIRCAGAWMKGPRARMVSNRGNSKGRGSNRGSKVNEVSSKGNNRGSRDKRASRDNQANQASSKALKTVNSKVASRRAARKTAASRRATETVAASIVRDQWAATG